MHDRGVGISATPAKETPMRTSLTLVLLLLFAASAPTAWGQDDPGDDEMQAADESEEVADAPVDAEVESGQGADSEELVAPEADEAAGDEPTESEAAQDSSADQESFAGDEDMSADTADAGDSSEEMADFEGGAASADDAAESGEASESESAAGDESANTTGQTEEEEEEESEDSADDQASGDTEDATEIADGETQTSDGGKVEGAGGNGANANQPGPAPGARPAPAAPAPAAKPTEPKAPGGSSPAWPTATFRFMVDFGLGTGEVPFQEVSGLETETQIIEYRDGNSLGIEIIGLYWHFVDLVWIFLFPLLYLVDRSLAAPGI